MARLLITMRRAAGARRSVIRIDYQSDTDALPHEHEQDHRRIVTGLFPSLCITNDPTAAVQVEREKPAREPVLDCGGCDDDTIEPVDADDR